MFESPWKKPLRSNPSGNCVESRKIGGLREVRDTKLRNSPILSMSENDFTALMDTIRR